MIKKYEKRIYLVLSVIVIVLLFWFNKNQEQSEINVSSPFSQMESNIQTEELGKEEKTVSAILVDVKGAVVHQGVYEVRETDRIKDVIALAGGFTKDADQTKVNLAARVHDEMVVYVPKIGEEGISSTAAPPSLDSYSNGDKKVNINTASIDEIQKLHGIGPAKAAAIIAYREEHGPFKKIEDLLNVTGIGEKSLEKIREQIIVR
jgi:competence protein ComEA